MCFCQIERSTIIAHRIDSVKFIVSFADSIYNYNDTVSVNLTIKNNSSTPIVIFDYNYFDNLFFSLRTNDSISIFNEIYLFGDWKYQLGYENFLYAKRILPSTKYNYTFSLILKSNINKIKYNNPIFSNHGIWRPAIYSVFFNLGYFVGNDINTLVKEGVEILDVKIKDTNCLPDYYLKTVLLGPLWIKQK